MQFLADHYWKRWIREYVPTLQRRPKWVKSRRNAQIGDLVLLAEDEEVRNRWAECSLEKMEVYGLPKSRQQEAYSTALLARYAYWRKLAMTNDY